MPAKHSLAWAVCTDAPRIKRWMRQFRGAEYGKRMERACLESATMIKGYAKAIVHVKSGRLKGSIAAEMRQRGVRAVAVVGSPVPYAAIEETRGLGRTWEELTPEQAAMGEHSYLGRAYVEKKEVITEIFRRYIGDT